MHLVSVSVGEYQVKILQFWRLASKALAFLIYHHLIYPFSHLNIHKVVATQGASTLVAALEPAVQAN